MKDLLREAWKEVFDTEEVSDDADFFEEGGDSIKAVQLSSWLVQKGIKLDLGKIFYTPVFSQLADTLEETDPMYVPDQLMTRELLAQKYQEVVNGSESSAPDSAPVDNNQQICDPANNQQICDPADNQQICDPADNQQICDPANNQQICDPANNQQICDPAGNAGFPGVQGASNMPFTGYFPAQQDMILPLIQVMISQQQTMLQMMQLILSMQQTMPGSFGPAFGFGKPRSAAAKGAPSVPPLSDEQKAKMSKIMSAYQSKKVDKPVEKPNVIGLKKAKTVKPAKSAGEVLEYVLSTVLKNKLDKQKDLFEQGLTSLDTVKIITRCGEYGYELKMQDIYMHSVFDELVQRMVPGKD